MEGGMVYTTTAAYWKSGDDGVTASLLNVFLADVASQKTATFDLPALSDEGKFVTVKGLCVSPADGKCGPPREFASPMMITAFYGYVGIDPSWGTFNFMALPLGFCMATKVDVVFNDDPEKSRASAALGVNIFSLIFYQGGSTGFLYYAIDQKYMTQTWKSLTESTPGNSGSITSRFFGGVKNPSPADITACFYIIVFMEKAAIGKGKSFQTLIAATTGELTEKASADGKAKPKVKSVNGGEKGKTYGGKTTGTKSPGANGSSSSAAGAASTAGTGGDASSANYYGSAIVVTMMAVVTMLNIAL